MSQGASKSAERRVATKNETFANNNSNVHPSVTFNTVPGQASHINGRNFIDSQAKQLSPGGSGTAEVINIIKRNFNNLPYRSWYKIPQAVRDAWFKEFMKKYWWYPESHELVRCSFEYCGSIQLKTLLSEARANQQRPEWIEKSLWKQLCNHWESKTNNKIQFNQKTPFAASTSVSKDKGKQEKIEQPIPSSKKDKREKDLDDGKEYKEMVDIIGKELNEKVEKLIESVIEKYIEREDNLLSEQEEQLNKAFSQLHHISNDTFSLPPSPPSHHVAVSFRPPPPGNPRKAGDDGPVVPSFLRYHQPNVCAGHYHMPASSSSYHFLGKQVHNYEEDEDDYDHDFCSDDYDDGFYMY